MAEKPADPLPCRGWQERIRDISNIFRRILVVLHKEATVHLLFSPIFTFTKKVIEICEQIMYNV